MVAHKTTLEHKLDMAETRLKKYSKYNSNNCWEWTGAVSPTGYGVMSIANVSVMTHRLAWTIYKSSIPVNMQVCHHCDNPKCNNVNHMFLGTAKDNMQDKVKKGRHRYNPQFNLPIKERKWNL